MGTRFFGLVALIALLSAVPAAPQRDTLSTGDAAATRKHIGEHLVFRVDWNPPWYLFFLPTMEAGEAELRISGISTYRNVPALQIVFDARSSGTLARLAKVQIEDHFEFYTDPDSLCTLGVSKQLREGKRKRSIEVHYERPRKRLYIKEIDTGVTPPKVKKDRFVEDIPDCVKDLFSALLSVRSREFHVGAAHRAIVGDNDSVKEVEVRVEKKEIVETPAGRFEAWRLNTVAILGGLFKEGGQFRMWLTADDRRMPVQFQAKASLGTVEGKLKLYRE